MFIGRALGGFRDLGGGSRWKVVGWEDLGVQAKKQLLQACEASAGRVLVWQLRMVPWTVMVSSSSDEVLWALKSCIKHTQTRSRLLLHDLTQIYVLGTCSRTSGLASVVVSNTSKSVQGFVSGPVQPLSEV